MSATRAALLDLAKDAGGTHGDSIAYGCDIAAMERAAYQRGEVVLAELLGRLLSAEEGAAQELQDAENAAEDAEAAQTRAETECENTIAACRSFLDELETTVNDTDTKLTRKGLLEMIERARGEILP